MLSHHLRIVGIGCYCYWGDIPGLIFILNYKKSYFYKQFKIVAAVLVLYVYQGAVETEVPGKQIARMIFVFLFFHLDIILRPKIVTLIIH